MYATVSYAEKDVTSDLGFIAVIITMRIGTYYINRSYLKLVYVFYKKTRRGPNKIGFSMHHHATLCQGGDSFDSSVTWGYAEPVCSFMEQT